MNDNPLFDRAYDVAMEIGDERARQIMDEGYMPSRDDAYVRNELALAAAAYLVHNTAAARVRAEFADGQTVMLPEAWPVSWHPCHFKPTTRRRDLVKAAALVVAEIERIDRAEERRAEALAQTNATFDAGGFMIDDEGSGQ